MRKLDKMPTTTTLPAGTYAISETLPGGDMITTTEGSAWYTNSFCGAGKGHGDCSINPEDGLDIVTTPRKLGGRTVSAVQGGTFLGTVSPSGYR